MNDYAELRAALEAGPTPGPWKWADDSRIATVTTVAEYRIGPDYKTSGQARYDFHAACEIDAAYIAAANPKVIRALLADRDALREALTELCDEIDKHEIHAAISKTNISWFKRKARAALAQEQGGSDASVR